MAETDLGSNLDTAPEKIIDQTAELLTREVVPTSAEVRGQEVAAALRTCGIHIAQVRAAELASHFAQSMN